jgi:hypothetical protein
VCGGDVEERKRGESGQTDKERACRTGGQKARVYEREKKRGKKECAFWIGGQKARVYG